MLPEYIALPEIQAEHNELHRKMFNLSFCVLPEVSATVPTIDTLPHGYGQLYESGNTRRMYINLNNNIFYFEGKNA